MARGLTPRRATILRTIITEYVGTAMPVASETIFRNYGLGVSPATIRNDMVYLEQEGYITRPYTSAGCIPLDRGYRYYVESLASDAQLPVEEQRRIRSLFGEVEEEFETWLKLAAAVMARLVRNAALVTFPRPSECRFRHLELVTVHEFVALLIIVMSEAVLRRQILSFDKPVTQEKLTGLANRLNAVYSGLTTPEVLSRKLDLSREEERIMDTVVDMMSAEEEMETDEPYLEGLRLMLDQPEFGRKERMLNVMELMEAKGWLNSVFFRSSGVERVHVVIGGENQDEALRDLSLVFSRYGVPRRIGGAVAVIGPTRMDYRRAISTVSCVSQVLSDLVAGVCRTNQDEGI